MSELGSTETNRRRTRLQQGLLKQRHTIEFFFFLKQIFNTTYHLRDKIIMEASCHCTHVRKTIINSGRIWSISLDTTVTSKVIQKQPRGAKYTETQTEQQTLQLYVLVIYPCNKLTSV